MITYSANVFLHYISLTYSYVVCVNPLCSYFFVYGPIITQKEHYRISTRANTVARCEWSIPPRVVIDPVLSHKLFSTKSTENLLSKVLLSYCHKQENTAIQLQR